MKNKGNIILNFISLIIAITGGLMSIDATIHSIGMFSPSVALWWPAVLSLSSCVNRIAILIKNIYGDWVDDGLINNSYPKAIAVATACLFMFSGCSTTTPDPVKNIRNAGINSAGSAALREAGKILGNFGAQYLMATAQSEMSGKKVDLLSSASSALWSQANSGTTSEVISDVTMAYTNGKAKQTAIEAAKVASRAIDSGKSPTQVTNAIATVLSTAAGAPPKS